MELELKMLWEIVTSEDESDEWMEKHVELPKYEDEIDVGHFIKLLRLNYTNVVRSMPTIAPKILTQSPMDHPQSQPRTLNFPLPLSAAPGIPL